MKLTRQGKTSATVITVGESKILYSYSTPVAAFVPGRGYLRTDRFYSVTTSRHINKWIEGWTGMAGNECTTVPQSEIDAIANGDHKEQSDPTQMPHNIE